MFKSLFLLVPATGLTYLGGIAFFVPASIFFAVYRLIYAKINSKPEADIENQLDSLREVFEDDPDRKTLLGDNSSVPTVNVPHSTPLVIVEEEDDRSCQFGHEPVLEYAPLDNQGTAEKTPPVVQDAEAFAPDCHSPQKELPSRSESSPDRHAEENNNDSIVVGSTELPEMFQAMRSTESIANPQMDTVNSGENVADPQAVSEEDLVANLIVSAAQSSDSIVVLASPASPQRQSDNPENLGFVVETIQSHFLKKDAPLVGLSGQIEEEDANVDTNNDNASICSDVGSYVTAGDSDDEREETSPMTTDDEDLDSYHSSVEDTEEEVAKSEAVQVNQKSVVQPSTPLAGGTSLGEHLVDPAAQEASTPTQRQTVVEEKQEEGSDESLYESCPQKSVRYIDDSDVDVDEPEPIVAKTLTSSWSRIPRFSFGNNLFTSRSIHRFEVLNTLPPLSSLRRVPSVLETPSVRRSVSFAMSSDMVDPDLCSTEPPLTPKGRMMKLKDKQLKGKPRDMSGVKDRENANTKKKISKEGAKPRFSI
ncbi:hypothetical protein CPB83DRAFT_198154 [Crepidotus variabilis]|uniref:Uncharacterized protein n=1 Tax=Crepidotus variabilis TaxID=179855 RepID=A0A9P6EJZ3_9AGAR|nr:hypothetical protein CPB83DRAFT_198154 [Crepidotus variabilis]